MEASSESGMDTESGSDNEDLLKDINTLAQLDDSSDVAYKITEQNIIIVNKPSSSSVNVHQDQSYTNLSNVNPIIINMSKENELNTNIDNKKLNTKMDNINPNLETNINVYPFELRVTDIKTSNTSNLGQQPETEALDLCTSSSNTSMTSPNKNNDIGMTSHFQPFSHLHKLYLHHPNLSTTNKDVNKLNSEENTNIGSLDNLAVPTEKDQSPSSIEFLTETIRNNTVQNITEIKVFTQRILENSIEKPNDDTSLVSKPLNENPDVSGSETNIKLFAEDTEPHWYKVQNNIVTAPVITENLPKIFADFPIFGKPENREDVESFQDRMVRTFVGCNLDDMEYDELKEYCSVDNLRTGKEVTVSSKIPTLGSLSGPPLTEKQEKDKDEFEEPKLYVLRKLKARMEQDSHNAFRKKLKYKGCRIIPMNAEEEQTPITEPPDLDPGKDILYKVRVYRPFIFQLSRIRAGMRGRHSVFSCDMYMSGRQSLQTLRERLVCRNDADLRVDVSARPDARALTTCKEMFPSGFLFINNVFYVDCRPGCRDTSAVIRQWAKSRGIGDFPVRDMAVTLQDISVKLAHPEVYVHQGNCEHIFLFSEIRLLSHSDPLHLSCYPCHTAFSQNHTIYCTTCADFGAKWIVTGCDRVPFDPAFLCEACFKQYLYKDGKKIGDFKAYAYRGNELNILKHQGN